MSGPVTRLLLRAVALAAALAALPLAAAPFPSRPFTVVVPTAPGSDADRLARLLAPELGKVWGQPVTVADDPSDGGLAAAWRAARAPWDAYTVFLSASATIDDPRKHYFAAVTTVATEPLAIVARRASRLKDVAGLVKAAKAKPGRLAYGALEGGRARALAGELFRRATGTDLRRVSFASAQEALAAAAAGKVDVAFVPAREAAADLAAGRVKALAVTGAKRAHALPAVPTVAESGHPGFEAVSWYGLMLPIATPRPLVALHNADANRVLELPAVREAILAMGLEPEGGPIARLFDLIRLDREQWPKLAPPGGK